MVAHRLTGKIGYNTIWFNIVGFLRVIKISICLSLAAGALTVPPVIREFCRLEAWSTYDRSDLIQF